MHTVTLSRVCVTFVFVRRFNGRIVEIRDVPGKESRVYRAPSAWSG